MARASTLRERALALVALLCALLGLTVAASGGSAPERAPVLVAVRSIAAGGHVPPEALRVVQIDARDRSPSMLSSISAAAYRVTLVPLRSGDYVAASALVQQVDQIPLRAGQRAFTLRVEPSAAPPVASLVPGGAVDVVVSTDADGHHAARSIVAASGLEVLAPARLSDGMVLVTLRTSVRQAVALTAAGSFAHDLRLLGRPAGDGRAVSGVAVTAAEVGGDGA